MLIFQTEVIHRRLLSPRQVVVLAVTVVATWETEVRAVAQIITSRPRPAAATLAVTRQAKVMQAAA